MTKHSHQAGVWTTDCEVMRIFTQILCSARVRPNLIYLESDNLNPNLAPSSVSPESRDPDRELSFYCGQRRK